ncbi:MAG: hypothetical protein ACRCY8_10070 [Dermatophilaceae bacterium]
MPDHPGPSRSVAVVVCGTDPDQVAASCSAVAARRDWSGRTQHDLPIAVVTSHEQRLAVHGRCPDTSVLATGSPDWPAATAVARAWARSLGDGCTVVAVREGALPVLDDAFLAAVADAEHLTPGSTDVPGPVGVLVLPPSRRLDVDPRIRGSLAERETALVLEAAGAVSPHPGLRYDQLARQGPAFAADDLAAQTRNAVVLDERAETPDDLVEVAARARRERASPFWAYDAIVAVNRDSATDRWRDLERRAEALGFDRRMERFPAVDHPAYPTAGATLSHRQVVEDAWRRGLRHVLLLEDDVVFRRGIRAILAEANAVVAPPVGANAVVAPPGSAGAVDVGGRPEPPPWDVLYLGLDLPDLTGRLDDVLPAVEGYPGVRRIDRRSHNLHAQVIRASAYELLLDELPRTLPDAESWCERWTATSWFLSEQYLTGRLRALVVWPRVAAQSEQLTARRVALHPQDRAAFVI